MRAKTQADFIKTALRVPPELHARIHEAAQEAGRTYNAEILARLEDSFDPAQTIIKVASLDDPVLDKLTKKIVDGLVRSTFGAKTSKPPRS